MADDRAALTIMVLFALYMLCNGGFNKYTEEANTFDGGAKSAVDPVLDPLPTAGKDGAVDPTRPYRVHKINLFWTIAQQQITGEQKLKKLKNELKILDKEVLKQKQIDAANSDKQKLIEERLHALIEKIGLASEPFASVFDYVADAHVGDDHRNTLEGRHENQINLDMWQEPIADELWKRAVAIGTFTKEDLEQLKGDLEKLEHRLGKKRHLERQYDDDKKNDDLKRRLKDISYKAEKHRKDIETRFFPKHSEL